MYAIVILQVVNNDECSKALNYDFKEKSDIVGQMQIMRRESLIFTDINILRLRYFATVWASQSGMTIDLDTLLMGSNLA